MPGLLLMTSLGHQGVKSPSDLENLVHAGLGYSAHAGNVDYSGHQVIDAAQGVSSNVWDDAGEVAGMLTTEVPHVQQSVSHTWTSSSLRVLHLIEQVIPDQLGWM